MRSKNLLYGGIIFCILIFSVILGISTAAEDKRKILYIPLDDRPINYQNVVALSGLTDFNLLSPSTEQLNSHENLTSWVNHKSSESQAALLALDKLVYGGLVESRKHQIEKHELIKRINNIKNIKSTKTPVYAFISVMRAPVMNTPYTMPDYYAKHGIRIYKYGELKDKINCGKATPEEIKKFDEIATTIPQELNDFIDRREKNHQVTKEALKLVKEGYIDYLLISKDDISVYGFARMETEQLEKLVEEYGIEHKVIFFPGTDECGMTLLAAMANKHNNYTPKIFVDYSQPSGSSLIPRYEDMALDKNIDRHIKAVGGLITQDLKNADLVLAVHNQAPTEENIDSKQFVSRIQNYIQADIPVTIADVKYPNSSDGVFLEELNNAFDLSSLAGYSGWNTAGNSIGATLGQGILYTYYRGQEMKDLPNNQSRILAYRLIEDWGYQAIVRPVVKKKIPTDQLYKFTDEELEKQITQELEQQLNNFARVHLKEDFGNVRVTDTKLPWHRLFDIEFVVK